MSGGMEPRLPYVDEHGIAIEAPRAVVWAALRRYAGGMAKADGGPLRMLLAPEPAAGFALTDSVPEERLVLAGRHRFARYELVFELADGAGGATQLQALTYAAFPGARGGVYRALVIGTRAHVVATRCVLRSIRRLALEQAGAPRGRR